ncbi:hypothetical protein PT974_04525 [Cladobotryum mycophilum]|uniref:Uncharacterized protein n=1 Tax=Cladobotryum mycophilum TaxID=491253 RepID=A0ABR0SVB7_9HYPO
MSVFNQTTKALGDGSFTSLSTTTQSKYGHEQPLEHQIEWGPSPKADGDDDGSVLSMPRFFEPCMKPRCDKESQQSDGMQSRREREQEASHQYDQFTHQISTERKRVENWINPPYIYTGIFDSLPGDESNEEEVITFPITSAAEILSLFSSRLEPNQYTPLSQSFMMDDYRPGLARDLCPKAIPYDDL